MWLGQIQVQTLLDTSGLHAPIHEVFLEATREAIDPYRHWLEPAAIEPITQRVILPVQAYLVRTRHHRILIDTCVGCGKQNPDTPDWHLRSDRSWLQRLAEAGLSPADIDYVFCTHLHSDHCGWNTELRDGRWVPTFPNAKYVFSRQEYDATARGNGEPFQQSVLPVLEVWLEPAVGHTEGHVVVNLKSGQRRAAMCGDMMHSPVQCPHPEWSPIWDRDQEQARRTRRSFLERHCDTDTIVLTAHFPPPSFGRVVPKGPGFLFVYGD
jgi:glyoxylase-like metal-dependent hydrolase (beta-lactamase superfamily II)